jgi:alpha-L-rhamnosidase
MPRSVNYVLLMIAWCAIWAANQAPAAAQGTGTPINLRCENGQNPQAVKVPQPQLTWAMNPGVTTVAYQVLVATSEEKLNADDGDLWDSGRVISEQRTAQYRGKPLPSRQRCYWKVRVWGSYYTPTRYSEPANWQMALAPF